MKPQEIIDLLMECKTLYNAGCIAAEGSHLIDPIKTARGASVAIRLHPRIDAAIKQLEQESRK